MCDTADDGVGISNSIPDEEQLKRVGLALGRSFGVDALCAPAGQFAREP